MIGTLWLGPVVKGEQDVLYTAPKAIQISNDQTVSFVIDDETTGATYDDTTDVVLDAGLTIQNEIADGTVVAPGSTVTLGTAIPGLSFDAFSFVSQSASGGTLNLVDTHNGDRALT